MKINYEKLLDEYLKKIDSSKFDVEDYTFAKFIGYVIDYDYHAFIPPRKRKTVLESVKQLKSFKDKYKRIFEVPYNCPLKVSIISGEYKGETKINYSLSNAYIPTILKPDLIKTFETLTNKYEDLIYKIVESLSKRLVSRLLDVNDNVWYLDSLTSIDVKMTEYNKVQFIIKFNKEIPIKELYQIRSELESSGGYPFGRADKCLASYTGLVISDNYDIFIDLQSQTVTMNATYRLGNKVIPDWMR